MGESTRTTVLFSAEDKALADRLAAEHGTTVTQVLRYGLRLLDLADRNEVYFREEGDFVRQRFY